VKASFLIVAIVAIGLSLPVSAAEPESPAGSAVRPALAARADAARSTGATIVVFNRPIVRLRAPVLGVSPAERADNAAKRIRALIAAGGRTVSVEQVPQGVAVKIGDNFALGITPDDVEGLGEVAMMAQANDAKRALEVVIAEMDEAHDAHSLLSSAGWAAAATVVWLAALWLLRRAIRFIGRRILRYADAKGDMLRAAGADIVQRDRVMHAIRVAISVVLWVFVALATYQWLGFVLARFPYTRPWGEGLASFLIDTLGDMLSAVTDSIPGLLVVVVIFVLARFFDGMLRGFFDSVQAGRTSLKWIDADSARPTRRLVTIAVWLFAIAMAYPYIPGAQTDAFKGVSVLLGLMVSVGASGIIGQALSGLILMYTRTYRPGEYVRVGDNEGTVVALGTFTTRVRTGMGEELTLPNSMVLATVTKNYSRTVHGAGFIVDATATIGYDTPWRQVQAMLIEAAQRTPGVLAEPAPRVFQLALSDFYVEYRIVCQAIPTEPLPRAVVVSALHANIQDVFNEHGVQIMSPHYLGDPDAPKIVPKAHWYAPPAKPPG
jgi:small-conductance mechanosensitive channel